MSTHALPPVLDLPDFAAFEKEWAQHGIFTVPGDIDSNWHKRTVWPVTRACLSGCTQPLVFLINSPGGYTNSAWMILNAIQSYLGPTVGIVAGRASSAAFTILQACKYRFCLPGSTGLIHSVSEEFKLTMFNGKEALARIEKLEEQSRITFEFLASRNPRFTTEQLVQLAQIDTSFPLTVESGWIDAVIPKLYPLHPLPDEWNVKIFGERTSSDLLTGHYSVT